MAKIRGVNSVSGENLHDFEIISTDRGVRSHPPPSPALRTGLYLMFNVKSQRVIFRDTQHWYNDHLFVRSQLLSLTYLEFFCFVLFFLLLLLF